MTKDFINKIKELPKLKLLIILFAIWQYFSIAGIALLGWSVSLVWLNLGLLLAFLLLCPVYESILLLTISIPFYVVIPNLRFESLSMWRILYLALFCIWLARDKKFRISEIKFLPWDKYFGLFLAFGVLSALFFGSFKFEALKQALFFINIYVFYLVIINTLKSKQQIFELIRYVIWAMVIIITLGFTQLFGSLLTDLDTFWVFWAVNLSQLYYGGSFASVALYSNSWFSFTGARELRMFSIMPDSQSFAYVCFIGLCMGTALTRSVFVHIRKWLWSGIRFAALGLILSGTRAVWVGMILPFLVVFVAYYKNFQKHLAKKFLWPFIIIFILFAISPIINKGLEYLRVSKFQENFLGRAASIYNLKEPSNRGRIEIWQSSLKFALAHPLGVGFGNFLISFQPEAKLKSYNEAAGFLNEKYNLPSRYVSAHSLYLQVFVEAGILGLAVFLAFFVSMLRYFGNFIRHYKHTEDFLVYFVTQAFLMVLWILAAAFFDITLFNDKVLMLFLINIGLSGLIVTRYQEYHEEHLNK